MIYENKNAIYLISILSIQKKIKILLSNEKYDSEKKIIIIAII